MFLTLLADLLSLGRVGILHGLGFLSENVLYGKNFVKQLKLLFGHFLVQVIDDKAIKLKYGQKINKLTSVMF